MQRNYIVVHGAKYYTGSVFIINFRKKMQRAVFVCYIPETNKIRCKISGSFWFINANDFNNRLVEITNEVDRSVHMPIIRKKHDMEIDGLFLGWMWYVFLMAISTIFYDRIGLWIFISIVFFSWRAKKLKEEGAYIEW